MRRSGWRSGSCSASSTTKRRTYLLALWHDVHRRGGVLWLRGPRAQRAPRGLHRVWCSRPRRPWCSIVLEKSPAGPEHLKRDLGRLRSTHVVSAAHRAGRGALRGDRKSCTFCSATVLEITSDPQGAHARGRRLFLWDLLFYATFGLRGDVGRADRPSPARVRVARHSAIAGYDVHGRARDWPWWWVGCSRSCRRSWALLGSVQMDLPAAPSVLVTLTADAGAPVVDPLRVGGACVLPPHDEMGAALHPSSTPVRPPGVIRHRSDTAPAPIPDSRMSSATPPARAGGAGGPQAGEDTIATEWGAGSNPSLRTRRRS
jgi:hypothetical protein